MIMVPRKEIHVALTVLRWNNKECRYHLVGGLLLSIEPRRDGRDVSSTFYPALLTKHSDNAQWHEGTSKETKSAVLVAKYDDDGFVVRDVSEEYQRVSRGIIYDMSSRANGRLFVRNREHWGPSFDERGFIRQSEIRVMFPQMPMPGIVIEECNGNPVSTPMWDCLVDMATTLIGFDEKRFFYRLKKFEDLGIPKKPKPQPFPSTEFKYQETTDAKPREAVPRTPKEIAVAIAEENDTVTINCLEALTSAVLSLSGVHVGYDDELIDDTSVPWQKCGTNSDCEDFAIAAVGLYNWLASRECRIQTMSNTRLGRFLAVWIATMYTEAVVATGFVTPSAARPDLDVGEDGLGGHGFTLLRRHAGLQSDFPFRWVLVECTALTVSYRPVGVPDPELPVETVCSEEFNNVIRLVHPSRELLDMKTSIGHASLLGLDKNGIPFKYKTVATVSNAMCGDVVTKPDGKTTGVDLKDFMVDNFLRVPAASPESYIEYDRMFRGFALRPTPTVDAAMTHVAVRPERRAPPFVETTVEAGQILGGTVAFTGDDLRRKNKEVVFPAGTDVRVYHTNFGDVVIAGHVDGTTATLGTHHDREIVGKGGKTAPRQARYTGFNHDALSATMTRAAFPRIPDTDSV